MLYVQRFEDQSNDGMREIRDVRYCCIEHFRHHNSTDIDTIRVLDRSILGCSFEVSSERIYLVIGYRPFALLVCHITIGR